MHADTPPNLSRLLVPYRPSRVLRSSFFANLLQVPRTNLSPDFRNVISHYFHIKTTGQTVVM